MQHTCSVLVLKDLISSE